MLMRLCNTAAENRELGFMQIIMQIIRGRLQPAPYLQRMSKSVSGVLY
jgi:hypothetical protein